MRTLTAALLLLAACLCAAQHATVAAKAIDKAPTIDGVLSKDEWSGAAEVTGSYDMQTGAAEPYGSRYWLAYDKTFIYVAARLPDPDPKQIKAVQYRQNVALSGDDYMVFAIDPFGTLGDTNQFEINPRGATNIRIAGGRAAKTEWLGEFEAKARITAEGWEVEARIPWGVMRLPGPGVRDARVTFGRIVQRTGRVYFTDNLSRSESNLGVWTGVAVPAPETRRSVKLLPYLYAGAEPSQAIFNTGLDFKAPITSSLDLVGSVNPDFRNIERQVLSLDFSYFERLASESRPFFLEGAEYFRTSEDAPLFASQRIRGFDFGVKTYGKPTESSRFALLDTVDLDRQNNFVGALHYDFSQNTGAVLALSDVDSPTLKNRATFVGFSHNFAPFTLFAQHMTTDDSVEGAGHRYNAGFYLQSNGWSNGLEYLEISPHFAPKLGFAPERDLKGITDHLEFEHPVKWGRVTDIGFGIGFQDLRTFEHTKYRRAVEASASMADSSGLSVEFGGRYEEFMGFTDRTVNGSVAYPRNSPYRRIALTGTAGFIAGHGYRSIGPSFAYRPWRNLQIAGSFQHVEHETISEQMIVSANYDINARDSISGRSVRRGAQTNLYLAYRRTGSRGNEYYLIIGDPNAPTFRSSIILKAVFPLEFRF